jgi:hypothetical protein
MKRNIIAAVIVLVAAVTLVAAIWYAAENTYPKVGGVDPRTGLRLIQIQFCSDVCPQYTRVFTIFENVTTPEMCAGIGGQTIRDAAWHGYIGCRPKANASDPSEVFG